MFLHQYEDVFSKFGESENVRWLWFDLPPLQAASLLAAHSPTYNKIFVILVDFTKNWLMWNSPKMKHHKDLFCIWIPRSNVWIITFLWGECLSYNKVFWGRVLFLSHFNPTPIFLDAINQLENINDQILIRKAKSSSINH